MKYADGLDKIFKVHLILAGLQELRYNLFGGKFDQAVFNNLKQISTHAGEKRFSLGEIYDPMNLLALCQYEFMLRKSLGFVISNELKISIRIAINAIEEVRDFYGCPPFIEKDEVMIVEVSSDKDHLKAIEAEHLEHYKGEFFRLLPIRPEDLYKTFEKDLGGFLNYNGNEKPTVEFVVNMANKGGCL